MNKLNSQTSFRKTLMSCMLVLIIAVTCLTSTSATQRTLTVLDGDATAVFKTTKNTVGEVLADANISVSPLDVVSVDLSTSVEDANVIEIKRARKINILDGKTSYVIESAHETAEEILKQNNIALNPDDLVYFAGSFIKITRIVKDQQIVNEPIAFETIYEDDPSLPAGTTKVAVEGKNGSEDVVYYDTYKNGEFIERVRASSLVIKKPVNKVVKVGKGYGSVAASAGAGAPANYKRVITCKATAYDGSYETLGKYNPRTALGAVPTVGTVAVDPKVIPLGTKLYIETVDGSYVYGYCFAGDTGGAIKGNRVDLFMASRREALNFGARQVNVYILE